MPAQDKSSIMTKSEVIALLGISMRKLEMMMSAKEISFSRIGRVVRFNRADVLALVPAKLSAYEAKPEPSKDGDK